jgi:hypothetical protein
MPLGEIEVRYLDGGGFRLEGGTAALKAEVKPRSLRSANRHAETACKKEPVRSGPFGSAQGRRDDRIV